MKASFEISGNELFFDLSSPIDISIPLDPLNEGVNAFYAPPFEVEPVVIGDFVGSVAEGSPVNFMNVFLNPHGNGTHTECVGHISEERFTINQCLKEFLFPADLFSINPSIMSNGDHIILNEHFSNLEITPGIEAIIIRTLPNDESKIYEQYSGNNPPYFHHEVMEFLVEKGIKHLLTDLPSVDREIDEGKVLGHRAYWQYPESPRTDSTITEMVYIPNDVSDGLYLLNLQIASFEMDASPSKPILYPGI